MAINVGNDYDVLFIGARDAITGAWINDANFTFTAFANWNEATGTGTAITGAVNLAMSYLAATNGNYQGTLPASVTNTLTPTMNPICVTVQASNYGIVRRTIDEVAY